MDNLTVKEGTDHSKQNSINTKRFKNLPKQDSKLDHSKSSSIEDLVPTEIKEELYNQRYEVLRGLLEKIKINELEITEEDLKDPFLVSISITPLDWAPASIKMPFTCGN